VALKAEFERGRRHAKDTEGPEEGFGGAYVDWAVKKQRMAEEEAEIRAAKARERGEG
jgi:hypothetical protein